MVDVSTSSMSSVTPTSTSGYGLEAARSNGAAGRGSGLLERSQGSLAELRDLASALKDVDKRFTNARRLLIRARRHSDFMCCRRPNAGRFCNNVSPKVILPRYRTTIETIDPMRVYPLSCARVISVPTYGLTRRSVVAPCCLPTGIQIATSYVRQKACPDGKTRDSR